MNNITQLIVPQIQNTIKPMGELLYLTISGAHLYGFEDEDSDIDYRGIFASYPAHILGIHKTAQTIEQDNKENKSDIVLHELSKTVLLALKGNCNKLEQINAKPIYINSSYSKEIYELRETLFRKFSRRGLYNSYRGLASHTYKHILTGQATAKKYLYTMRSLMAGIYFMKKFTIEPNINVLNEEFGFEVIPLLVKDKKEGKRKLPECICKELDGIVIQLFNLLDNMFQDIAFPDNLKDGSAYNVLNNVVLLIRYKMLEQKKDS